MRLGLTFSSPFFVSSKKNLLDLLLKSSHLLFLLESASKSRSRHVPLFFYKKTNSFWSKSPSKKLYWILRLVSYFIAGSSHIISSPLKNWAEYANTWDAQMHKCFDGVGLLVVQFSFQPSDSTWPPAPCWDLHISAFLWQFPPIYFVYMYVGCLFVHGVLWAWSLPTCLPHPPPPPFHSLWKRKVVFSSLGW